MAVKKDGLGKWMSMLWIGLLLFSLAAVGCSEDGKDNPEEGELGVCNYNPAVYDVELRRARDGEIVRGATLGAPVPGDSNCQVLGDIVVGTYYVDVYRQGVGFIGRSSDFLIPENPDVRTVVFIAAGGDIGVLGGGVSGEGRISVCNHDDAEYIVELRRETDQPIATFDLEELVDCDEFNDVDSGVYYLRVYDEGDLTKWTDSPIFFLADDDTEYLFIDTTGSVLRGEE